MRVNTQLVSYRERGSSIGTQVESQRNMALCQLRRIWWWLWQHGCCLARMPIYCDSLNEGWVDGGHDAGHNSIFVYCQQYIF